jgi:hypothetical protein
MRDLGHKGGLKLWSFTEVGGKGPVIEMEACLTEATPPSEAVPSGLMNFICPH